MSVLWPILAAAAVVLVACGRAPERVLPDEFQAGVAFTGCAADSYAGSGGLIDRRTSEMAGLGMSAWSEDGLE